jgi:hypothetical protein
MRSPSCGFGNASVLIVSGTFPTNGSCSGFWSDKGPIHVASTQKLLLPPCRLAVVCLKGTVVVVVVVGGTVVVVVGGSVVDVVDDVDVDVVDVDVDVDVEVDVVEVDVVEEVDVVDVDDVDVEVVVVGQSVTH